MTTHTKPAAPKMTVPEFLAWVETQDEGRYELVDGEVVAMAPEHARHNVVKGAVYRTLYDAVRRAGLPCTVFTDGMAVVIDGYHSREPDVAVQCGVPFDPDALTLGAPLIVVEVVSPSSGKTDAYDKLADYFSVPNIRHYLVVYPEKAMVIHHQKEETGTIVTRILREGDIALDPPGMTMAVAAVLDITP